MHWEHASPNLTMISDLLKRSTRALARTDIPLRTPRVDIFGERAALKAFVAISVDMMADVSIECLVTGKKSSNYDFKRLVSGYSRPPLSVVLRP